MISDAEKAAYDAHWARVDEHYPINDNWQADGWSTPRFKGTGRRPERGVWEEDDEKRVVKDKHGNIAVDEHGVAISEKQPGDPILPGRTMLHGRAVGILFDGQYVYTCDPDSPNTLETC